MSTAATIDAKHRPPIEASLDREAIYAQLQPLVGRLIYTYGGSDVETRRDLEGEVYCRFASILDAFDPKRGVPLRPYLVRQLSSSVYTYARRRWRRLKREVSFDGTEDLTNMGHHFDLDPTDQWIDDIEMEKRVTTLSSAVASLPKRQRQVLIWRYYDQHSFEAIALALDIKISSTRSLLRHAIANLRSNAFAEIRAHRD